MLLLLLLDNDEDWYDDRCSDFYSSWVGGEYRRWRLVVNIVAVAVADVDSVDGAPPPMVDDYYDYDYCSYRH